MLLIFSVMFRTDLVLLNPLLRVTHVDTFTGCRSDKQSSPSSALLDARHTQLLRIASVGLVLATIRAIGMDRLVA
jgi:hypothetical protein